MANVVWSQDRIDQAYAIMGRIAERHRSDPEFQAKLAGSGARDALVEMGMRLPEGMDVKVIPPSNDVLYLVMPPDPNIELSDEALASIAGGIEASTMGTLSSFGTVLGICASTISTGSTISW